MEVEAISLILVVLQAGRDTQADQYIVPQKPLYGLLRMLYEEN